MDDLPRCAWPGDDPLYRAYHDGEWGVPEHDSRALWEKLVLDGFQAGLSWITILRKRDNFRRAFAGFDPETVARWGEPEVARLVTDAGIIRHRGKIEAAITGARAFITLEERNGFSTFVWDHVQGTPVQNHWHRPEEVPTDTEISARLSRNLRRAGFRFCGPVITYAWMQACGLVNDHLTTCHRHAPCAALG